MGVLTAPVGPGRVGLLEGFFREAAREEGLACDGLSVTLMLAEATLRLAAGQSLIWVALATGERREASGESEEEETAGSPAGSPTHASRLTPHGYPIGMLQIDERFDPAYGERGSVYEARRLYVAPEHRGGRVALALLSRAAADLLAPEATIFFTVRGDKLPRLYRRLGAESVRTIFALPLADARAGLGLAPPEESLWVEPPSRSLSER